MERDRNSFRVRKRPMDWDTRGRHIIVNKEATGERIHVKDVKSRIAGLPFPFLSIRKRLAYRKAEKIAQEANVLSSSPAAR